MGVTIERKIGSSIHFSREFDMHSSTNFNKRKLSSVKKNVEGMTLSLLAIKKYPERVNLIEY